MSLRTDLEKKEIVVVTGSGGVGKTSVSAALALAAAADRRTIVLTIDPAKRLAGALGLGRELGHASSEVELPEGSGSLEASMLDMKTAWDEVVNRHSPSKDVSRRIMENRLYQGLSEHFVGSQGYMAMEQLAQLHRSGDYDLIVIDTPPTRSALDFLDAPKRMTDFVGGSLLRWVAKPYAAAGKVGMKAFNLTASPFLKVADRVLGSQVLEDLSTFVMDFQNLYDGFKERAEEVLELLRAPTTGFVVVTTLEGPPLGEAGFFIDRLVDEGLPLAGVIANKVIDPRFADPEADGELERLDAADPARVAEALGIGTDDARSALTEGHRALTTLAGLSRRDRSRLRDLGRRARSTVSAVPLLTHDVQDLDSLRALADHILEE